MRSFVAIIIGSIAFAACSSPKPFYEWYDSEQTTYTYHRTPNDKTLARAMKQYKLMIERPRSQRGVAPPGVNAEYGYLLVKAGKKEEGMALLNAEMDTYPESKVYISKMIKNLEQ